jgi:hypothetical protein
MALASKGGSRGTHQIAEPLQLDAEPTLPRADARQADINVRFGNQDGIVLGDAPIDPNDDRHMDIFRLRRQLHHLRRQTGSRKSKNIPWFDVGPHHGLGILDQHCLPRSHLAHRRSSHSITVRIPVRISRINGVTHSAPISDSSRVCQQYQGFWRGDNGTDLLLDRGCRSQW